MSNTRPILSAAPEPVDAAPDSRRAADSADRAYQAIRRQLVEFRIKPETRINELRLAKSLDLSRTPIREALNRLASEGFVVFAPNRGFFFRGIDIDEIVDLFEWRMVIETGAFRLGCERASPEEVASLRAYWDEMAPHYARRDPDEILGIDEGFHMRLVALSGNPELERQLAAINARIRFIRRVQIERAPEHADLVGGHDRILAAAEARDAEGGLRLLRGHITMTAQDAGAALKEALLRLYTADAPSSRRRRTRPAADAAGVGEN